MGKVWIWCLKYSASTNFLATSKRSSDGFAIQQSVVPWKATSERSLTRKTSEAQQQHLELICIT
ncbi:hypothetical protein Lal_00014671 [Lupinus albus]|nr:hypothetical protein Lal_00014671 [Lupinus albus]